MTGLVRNEDSPCFEMLYNADGSVHVFAKALAYITQASLCKVVYSGTGFVVVPFEASVDEFFVAWNERPLSIGVERKLQIGGVTRGLTYNAKDSMWLCASPGGTVFVESIMRPKNSFARIVGGCAVLFPIMVSEVSK